MRTCYLPKFSAEKRNSSFSEDEIKRAVRRQRSFETESAAPALIVYHRDLPRREPNASSPSTEGGAKVILEEAVEGVEVHSGHGKAFMVCTHVDDLEGAECFSGRFQEKVSAEDSALRQRIASACPSAELMLDDLILIDIETTGLGNSPLFLIGTMVWEMDGLEVRQYLARNYAEEAAVIAAFIDTCAPKKLLVTFNGKSFDFPFIRTRAAANRIPFHIDPPHFDLLHECRRVWKDVLPNCRLQTLERYVCKRARYGDIPGSQIPEVYHEYVRTENARLIAEILKHNLLDLVTMADLMTRLPLP